MKQFWKNLFFGRTGKPYSAWQIELTSRCPLRCRMCNRQEYKNHPRGDMSFDGFKTLLPYLRDVDAVVLEGWGESLLHPRLIECLRLVKEQGPRVGFVTSGSGLDETYISKLVHAEVDFMGFSFSGATPGTHNAIRVNSDLEVLLRDIQTLQELKSRRQAVHPLVHIAYLLVKENIHEVSTLLERVKGLGIAEVVLINLIHVTNPWQDGQRVFGRDPAAAYVKILDEAEQKARELKIKLIRPSLAFRDVAVCSENPLKNLYLSTAGDVSPCVYLNPPLPSPFKRIFQGKEAQVKSVTFGNLFHEPLEAVWNRPRYIEFRERFALRKQAVKEMTDSLLGGGDGPRWRSLPDPPDPCRTCYKILGV